MKTIVTLWVSVMMLVSGFTYAMIADGEKCRFCEAKAAQWCATHKGKCKMSEKEWCSSIKHCKEESLKIIK